MEFTAQYQQAPVPIGGNLIKWHWFKHYEQAPHPSPGDKLYISWDTAQSSGQLADYSACVVLLVRGSRMYILDVVRSRLEYPELKRAVIESNRRWCRNSCTNVELLIEKAGSGLSLIQDLRGMSIYPIGIKPEGDKVMRMSGQTAPIEAGAVYLPAGAPWLGEFKKELLEFPAGRNDDQVDALSQALKRARAPGPPVAQTGTFQLVR